MKTLRAIGWALLFALLFGFLVGTALRLRMERTPVYVGSAPAALPLHVADTGAGVLHASQGEEPVG